MGRTGLIRRLGLAETIGAILIAAYAVAVLAGPLIFDASGLSLLYLTLFFVCLSAAWNLFSGLSGYINFGFTAFVGIGMYVSVIALVDFKFSVWPAYLASGLAAALFAAVLGYPVLRIRGAYFSIAMLAIAEAMRVLVSTDYFEPVTRGGRGFPVLAGSLTQQYFAMLMTTFAVLATSLSLVNSRFGLELIAIREDETAAEGLGVNTARIKVMALVISAFFAGVAGGIHATFVHYIDPNSAFDIKLTIMPIIMTIFGGLGTVLGPLIGGVTLEFISDYSWLYLGRMNVTIFGLILVALIIWQPEGLIVRLKELGKLPKTRML
jgi:branched-chain amino acid transport system permease protein